MSSSSSAGRLPGLLLAAGALVGAGALLLLLRKRRQRSDAAIAVPGSPGKAQQLAEARAAAAETRADALDRRVRALELELLEARAGIGTASRPLLKRVVVTGGPCAGKTTGLSQIKSRLEDMGIFVLCCPEVATMLINSGAPIPTDATSAVAFQTSLLHLQIALEDAFIQIARASNENCVIIFDRGCMDGSAYVSAKQWDMILDELNTTTPMLRDRRYDCVVHFVTAAEGAEAFYTLANNDARSETPEQAREKDRATLQSWVGHEHLYIVDNSRGFDAKIKTAVERISALVGAPAPGAVNRKFVLRHDPSVDMIRESGLCKNIQVFEVEQTYLLTDINHCKSRIRRKSQGTHVTYYHQQWSRVGEEEVLYERIISSREFLKMESLRDPKAKQVSKTLVCFVFGGLLWEVNLFNRSSRVKGAILEVEVDSDSVQLNFPPFLDVGSEVTHDSAFDSYALAKMEQAQEECPADLDGQFAWKRRLSDLKRAIDSEAQQGEEEQRGKQ